MSKQEELAKAYRNYREECGVTDPIMLDEIEEAYYQGITKQADVQSDDLDVAIGEYCSDPDNFITFIDTGFAYRSEEKDDIPLIVKAIKFDAQWQKQQMLKGAISTIIQKDDCGDLVPTLANLKDFKEGDKVQVIILKDEKDTNPSDTRTNRKFTFGKYKGREVREICQINPSYLTWLEENTNFRMNDEERAHYLEFVNRDKKRYEMHPGGEARCDPWESWSY